MTDGGDEEDDNLPVAAPGGDLFQELLNARQMDAVALLEQMHKEMLAQLLVKLKAGQASHQELAVMRNLLRDNGLTSVVKPAIEHEPTEAIGFRVNRDVPELDDPEYED